MKQKTTTALSSGVVTTEKAPAAIGTYAQARVHGDTLYISGQIPLDPASMELVEGEFEVEARQVFANLAAIAEAAGTSLANALKITIYLTDLGNFNLINEVMADLFEEPFPARAAVEVSALPKGVRVEADAIVSMIP